LIPDGSRLKIQPSPGGQPASCDWTTGQIPRSEDVSTMTRRDFHRYATAGLSAVMGLILAVPGVAYIVSPLRAKGRDEAFETLTSLSQLDVDVPRSFSIIEERRDAWVKYPREPVGSVWLVRQPAGTDPPVLAFTSECPHLGCAVNLAADGKGFLCPCHTSAFDLDGKPKNQVPPRPMDRLDVELTPGNDPEVRVKFQRFRTQSKEKTPLV
jgi:menaquinol-cytochrome c reductase iron-sulfur subunit